ncbi:MAG: hypothetical protein K2X39_07180 [Silvanigrellaceae bacterium]|jgi:hypothetical protein|nr:hypothetical protein [Silvanigrellaceae bacterium]
MFFNVLRQCAIQCCSASQISEIAEVGIPAKRVGISSRSLTTHFPSVPVKPSPSFHLYKTKTIDQSAFYNSSTKLTFNPILLNSIIVNKILQNCSHNPRRSFCTIAEIVGVATPFVDVAFDVATPFIETAAVMYASRKVERFMNYLLRDKKFYIFDMGRPCFLSNNLSTEIGIKCLKSFNKITKISTRFIRDPFESMPPYTNKLFTIKDFILVFSLLEEIDPNEILRKIPPNEIKKNRR